MLDRLPEYIDPLQLADKQGALKGQMPLNSLDRLAEMLIDNTGYISVELFFSREGRLAIIEGKLETVLQLTCQNCLQALEWPVEASVKLGIVTSMDQANRLPEEYEPLLVDEEKILVKDFLEDELLLILPTFPKHPHHCLIQNGNNDRNDSATKINQSTPEHPFSILANLKNTGDI
ncbi:MAG: YceD family protein [Methylococcaceae bacterium]